MDSSRSPASTTSLRRELQGPRPTPLKLCKESYKIRKPPATAPPTQHRPPVIIYRVSPKIIHTSPSDFMSLVQRLTGSAAADNNTTSLPSPCEAISPAARLASYEKTAAQAVDVERMMKSGLEDFDQLGITGAAALDRSSLHPGILSPVPSSLESISPDFFSVSGANVPNTPSFMHLEQSPTSFHVNKSFVDNTFLVSPNNNFLSASLAALLLGLIGTYSLNTKASRALQIKSKHIEIKNNRN